MHALYTYVYIYNYIYIMYSNVVLYSSCVVNDCCSHYGLMHVNTVHVTRQEAEYKK